MQLPKIDLPRCESAILDKLASAPGVVRHHQELQTAIIRARGYQHGGRPVRAHVHILRKRVAPYGLKIICLPHLGYMLKEAA